MNPEQPPLPPGPARRTSVYRQLEDLDVPLERPDRSWARLAESTGRVVLSFAQLGDELAAWVLVLASNKPRANAPAVEGMTFVELLRELSEQAPRSAVGRPDVADQSRMAIWADIEDMALACERHQQTFLHQTFRTRALGRDGPENEREGNLVWSTGRLDALFLLCCHVRREVAAYFQRQRH
jgi:hypothetical protein